MGFGLIIAVLGLGSTFAANIQINSNRDSEFGQGLTQTVYCGENDEGESITVTPISAFVNSVDIVGDEVWREPVYTGRQFITASTISGLFFSRTKVILNDETGDELNTRGYYVNSILTEYYDDFYKGFRSVPAISTPPTVEEFDTFVPQVVFGNNYGFYIYETFTPGRFVNTTPTTFELGGITITDIPTDCVGRDFIISAYGSNGPDPLKLSSALGGSAGVTEIAVNWDPLDLEPDYSFNRRIPEITDSNVDQVVIQQVGGTENSLKIIFSSTAGRLLTDAFAKIVVETQENIVGD
jgi:hypothetical protein